jgi:hypothetical protein
MQPGPPDDRTPLRTAVSRGGLGHAKEYDLLFSLEIP